MQLYRGFGCIYAHKNENLQKTRVSATSCVFEYYISNIKNQKRKKLRENWNSLHNLVLLVGFLIFHVLVCQLVGQKNQKKGTSFFRVQDHACGQWSAHVHHMICSTTSLDAHQCATCCDHEQVSKRISCCDHTWNGLSHARIVACKIIAWSP